MSSNEFPRSTRLDNGRPHPLSRDLKRVTPQRFQQVTAGVHPMVSAAIAN